MTRGSIRGFAAGLLIATLIIGGFYIDKNNKEKSLSLAELKAASNKLGYELVEKTKPAVSKPSKTTTSQPITYKLAIKKGMSSEDIGAILKKNNIIKDTSLFASYLRKNHLTTKIQIGEFTVTSDMTTAEIANTITK
ncbi:endolytic transglycosylase MltG [Bacillus sp. JJ722]|uniref:endolytic transglycosylase MltG n=1 Tax=Bacillus sp. JJ722 TaxID=3122973 RepID=UPI002FFFD919